MSSPVESRLRDLNLDPEKMAASTRARERGRQAAQGQASQQAAQAGPSNANYLKSYKSGTMYDIQGFSQDARQRADDGFNTTSGGPLKTAVNHGNYFVFELNIGNIVVRIKAPGARDQFVGVCSCRRANESIACKHVFWLVDQVVPEASPQLPKLAQNGMLVADTPLFELIREIGVDRLKQRTEQGPEAGTTEEEREAVQKRMLNQLHEILSIFEPGSALPDELRSEIGRIYKEFSDYIVDIAYQRPGSIDVLERIVPSELRAGVYFEKMRNQVNGAFNAFDHDDDSDAESCITRLEELLDQVVENYGEREASKFPAVAKYAVGVLITILEGVLHRKEDLYELAMGQQDASMCFTVLEALSTKPAEVLSLYRDRIGHIAREIETEGAPGPIPKLMSNVAGVAGVSVASESQKRKGPGDNDNGGSKKKGKSQK